MAIVSSVWTLEREPVYAINYKLTEEEQWPVKEMLKKDRVYNELLNIYPEEEYNIIMSSEVKVKVFKKTKNGN